MTVSPQWRRAGPLIACLLGAATLASACSSSTPAATATGGAGASASSGWDAIVAAAQKEGSANILTTEIPGWVDAETSAFKSTAGLTMNTLARGANGVLETRLTSEVQANAIQTDVYEDVDRSFFVQHADWFVDLSAANLPNYAAYPQAAKWKAICVDDKWDVSGVTYNTNLVTGSDIPQTWQDLTNPKWAGKVVLSDPSPGGFYLQWAVDMQQNFGDDYLKKIAQLHPTLQASSVAAAQDVASGAAALSFLSQVDSGSDVKAKGGPIGFQILRNPDVGSQACVGILKGSPHPNAAKVLLNFLMSADSQSAACKAGVPNVSPLNATGCFQVPAGWKPPQVNDQGVFPGMDNATLKTQVLQDLGLK